MFLFFPIFFSLINLGCTNLGEERKDGDFIWMKCQIGPAWSTH